MKLFSVINLSKESPQKDACVATADEAILKMSKLKELGSDFIDIGARSSFTNSVEIDEDIEQQRLAVFFTKLPPSYVAFLSLDTWSDTNACLYLDSISILNYTSTYFPDTLVSKLADTGRPIILNYLSAPNPYALRKTPYSPPSSESIIDYFKVTVPYLKKKGVNIMAIDPNLGMWHPQTPHELKPNIQKNIIESIPVLKEIAPVFIVAPRTNNSLNNELIELILSFDTDFIRTHDLEAIKKIISARGY